MKKTINTVISVILLAGSVAAASTQSGSGALMQRLQEGAVVEFPAGSDIPLTVAVEGDLIETRRDEVIALNVKKKFWLKLSSNEIQMSFDGQTYKPLQSYIGGSISVGMNAGGEAEVRLRNFLK